MSVVPPMLFNGSNDLTKVIMRLSLGIALILLDALLLNDVTKLTLSLTIKAQLRAIRYSWR